MMECNKDEALRAKEIAEKKMQSNDFEGARKIAMKSLKLFPKLGNISQVLTVCSVHCAAKNKILGGSEKDFYGILQLDKFADAVAIKKQYRKLALTLHPDKNKLHGAEAAFKLIGEANAVLLDPGKKVIYDRKVSLGTARGKPPSNQFCSTNHNQTTTFNTSVPPRTFWTACPYCDSKFQYLRLFVNLVLPCQSCMKTFTAYELDSEGAYGVYASRPPTQGVPPKSSNYPTPVYPPKTIPNTRSSRVTAPNTTCYSASNTRSKSGSASDGKRSKSMKRDANKERESRGRFMKEKKIKHVVI